MYSDFTGKALAYKWKAAGGLEIISTLEGFMIFRFTNEEDKQRVQAKGTWVVARTGRVEQRMKVMLWLRRRGYHWSIGIEILRWLLRRRQAVLLKLMHYGGFSMGRLC